MPTAPCVVAAATRTFAPVSKTPTPTSSGSIAARRRERRRRHERPRRRRPEPTATRAAVDRPRGALVGARVDADEEEAEAERRDDGEPGSGREARAVRRGAAPARATTIPASDERDPEPLQRSRHVSPRRVDRERDDRRRRPRSARRSPSRRRRSRGRGRRARSAPRLPPPRRAASSATPGNGVAGRRATQTRTPTSPTACETARTVRTASAPRCEPAEEVADAPARRRQRQNAAIEMGACSEQAAASAADASVVADGARRGLRVELVRVVEDGRLGGSRRRPVVVTRDRVQELGEDGGVEVARRAPRSSAARGGRGRGGDPPRSGGTPGPAPSSPMRPTSCRSAAASEEVGRRRGWSCAVSRQSVATPTVCSSRPPA